MSYSKNELHVDEISFRIDKKSILNEVSFSVKSKGCLLIIGASGSGKTTLISLLAGLQTPNNGKITYGDTSLYDMSESDRDQFRGKHIGILFQNFHLIPTLTVLQNILLAPTLSAQKPDMEYIHSLLDRLHITGKKNQNVRTLSIGESQRVALARAMVNKPRWLLCDEPTSSLDDESASAMLELLQRETKSTGCSLIIVTHDSRVKKAMKNSAYLELGAVS